MDKIVSLCKRRGFIFLSSEIYGGLGSVWDYGPLGVELKNNLKRAWWKNIVHQRNDIEGLDAAILMRPEVWKASGHVESFFDLWLDCRACKKRFRADDASLKNTLDPIRNTNLSGKNKISNGANRCPECGGEMTSPRPFNLMFKTSIGPVEDRGSLVYLRPETAQGIFANFTNVLNTTHRKLPFGIAQIGKAFRNEVTTGNFTFRSREFEQMELEYFVKPDEDEKWFEYWVDGRINWYLKLGIKKENLKLRPHTKEELAHYAKSCSDIEYNFPFGTSTSLECHGERSRTIGWSELEGVANRTDFDLRQHSKFSGKDLSYFDEETKKKYLPYIIEPSGGVDRACLAFLVDAYREEEVRGEKRVVLGLNKELAPIKVAILPLLRNRPQIVEMAKKINDDLRKQFKVSYDDTAAIGRLYRRQDEVGTPYCVTVDVQSLEDKAVTVRSRDTMEQERISLDRLRDYLVEKL